MLDFLTDLESVANAVVAGTFAVMVLFLSWRFARFVYKVVTGGRE